MSNSTEQLPLRFEYGDLDADTGRFVQERAERIHNLARMTATGIVQIGQYLTEVKGRLKHGLFLQWVDREFGWAHDTARNFMMVYERFKLRNFRNLEIDVSALYLIAAPKTPEPVAEEVIRRAESGETITHAGARAVIQRFADTGELPNINVSLPKLIEQRRAAIENPDRFSPVRFANHRPPAEDPGRLASLAKEREEVKANSDRAVKIFSVIGSIENLCATTLTVAEIAAQIQRLNTPDKDWPGQLSKAQRMLADLMKELEL